MMMRRKKKASTHRPRRLTFPRSRTWLPRGSRRRHNRHLAHQHRPRQVLPQRQWWQEVVAGPQRQDSFLPGHQRCRRRPWWRTKVPAMKAWSISGHRFSHACGQYADHSGGASRSVLGWFGEKKMVAGALWSDANRLRAAVMICCHGGPRSDAVHKCPSLVVCHWWSAALLDMGSRPVVAVGCGSYEMSPRRHKFCQWLRQDCLFFSSS